MQKTLRNVTRKVLCSIRRTNEIHRKRRNDYFYYKVGTYCFTLFYRVLFTLHLSPVTYVYLCILREDHSRLVKYDFFRHHIDAYHNLGITLFTDDNDYRSWLDSVASEYKL